MNNKIVFDYDAEKSEMTLGTFCSVLEEAGFKCKIEGDIINKKLIVDWDPYELMVKRTRKAGPKEIKIGHISVEHIRNRMNTGETAEMIAKELGISRKTLFRRLKDAKEKNQKYLF